jgi:hypothetical protein
MIDGGTNNQGGTSTTNAPDNNKCDSNETYSRIPISPAPTIYMICLWIAIYLDATEVKVSWTSEDLSTNQDVVAESPKYEFLG